MYYPFTFTKNLWGFGSELESFINPFNNLQMILAFAIDEPNLKNRVSFSKKAGLKIDYEISKNTKQALTESMHAAAEILFESGVESVHLPTGRDFLIHRDQRADLKRLISGRRFDLTQFTLSAAHLMGTCRMGTSLQDSVTDSWGRVHEHPDVYIADASLFPMPSEVNPYLTVMALADRVSEGIKNDLGV
jgi:choline dehydrogenase-like flavoprotein